MSNGSNDYMTIAIWELVFRLNPSLKTPGADIAEKNAFTPKVDTFNTFTTNVFRIHFLNVSGNLLISHYIPHFHFWLYTFGCFSLEGIAEPIFNNYSFFFLLSSPPHFYGIYFFTYAAFAAYTQTTKNTNRFSIWHEKIVIPNRYRYLYHDEFYGSLQIYCFSNVNWNLFGICAFLFTCSFVWRPTFVKCLDSLYFYICLGWISTVAMQLMNIEASNFNRHKKHRFLISLLDCTHFNGNWACVV